MLSGMGLAFSLLALFRPDAVGDYSQLILIWQIIFKKILTTYICCDNILWVKVLCPSGGIGRRTGLKIS